MLKFELPSELQAEISQAAATLHGVPSVTEFKALCGLAQRALGFYQKRVPEIFADHVAGFYRERRHALEVGEQCDACASLMGWRNHAHEIEGGAVTPEKTAWLKMIFEKVSSGQLHLRK